jgi:hypothetical protein
MAQDPRSRIRDGGPAKRLRDRMLMVYDSPRFALHARNELPFAWWRTVICTGGWPPPLHDWLDAFEHRSVGGKNDPRCS